MYIIDKVLKNYDICEFTGKQVETDIRSVHLKIFKGCKKKYPYRKEKLSNDMDSFIKSYFLGV